MTKQLTKQQIESQIKVIERLLESQPKVLEDGKWNPKWFAMDGKIQKLKKQLANMPVSNLHQSWNDFLSQ